jgi:surface-anchored protein
MAISCPTGGGATTVFGHDNLLPAPYRVTITYGDGDKYSNDSGHLGAVFSHTYTKPGTYTVRAEVTGSAGGAASATCTYRWGG